jgi:hypothetical protein
LELVFDKSLQEATLADFLFKGFQYMSRHIYLLFGVVLLLVIVTSLRFEYGVVPNPALIKETIIVTPSNERIVKRLNNGRIVFEENPPWQITDLDSPNLGDDRDSTDGTAWTLVKNGIRHWEVGEKTQALSQWETVREEYAGTEPAFAALINTAQGLRDTGKADSAILAYKSAIEMQLPDSEDSVHYICIQLSQLYLECQDLPNALAYARLARTTYQPFCFCAICKSWDDARIDRYIDHLQTALHENLPVRLETVEEWNAAWERHASTAASP